MEQMRVPDNQELRNIDAYSLYSSIVYEIMLIITLKSAAWVDRADLTAKTRDSSTNKLQLTSSCSLHTQGQDEVVELWG